MDSKPVTMRHVADHAGVSTTTVSHVINETRPVSDDLRQRVYQAIKELNYQPNVLARSLRRNETYTISLIVPNNANPFYAELARAVEKVCFDAGYSVVLCNSDRDLKKEIQYVDLMLKRRVDGMVFVGAWVGEHVDHLARVQEQGIPLVAIDRNTHGLPIDCVVADNQLGGEQATTHLLELGHERIACNDLMAIGAIRAALDLGYQVPDDLSIVGFDDISMASFSNPALTTVNHPKCDMGFLAASMLIEHIRDDSLPPRKEVLPTELVIRQSTQKQD